MMVRLRMRTTRAGPDGVVHTGAVIDVTEAAAAELLALGYADQEGIEDAEGTDSTRRRAMEAADAPPADTATAPPAETAAASGGRSARGRG